MRNGATHPTACAEDLVSNNKKVFAVNEGEVSANDSAIGSQGPCG